MRMKTDLRNWIEILINPITEPKGNISNKLQEAEDRISGLKDKAHDPDEMNNTCGLKKKNTER